MKTWWNGLSNKDQLGFLLVFLFSLPWLVLALAVSFHNNRKTTTQTIIVKPQPVVLFCDYADTYKKNVECEKAKR
jgi:hypothetical protein